LPAKPDIIKIRDVLLHCLEHHYGNSPKAVVIPDKYENIIKSIVSILKENGLDF